MTRAALEGLMRTLFLLLVAATTIVAAACFSDRVTDNARASFDGESLVVALTSAAPGRLQRGIDSVALRRLLNAMPVDLQPLVRAAFEEHSDRWFEIGSIEGVPRSQALIEAVTAPRQAAAARRGAPSASPDVWSAAVSVVLVEGDAAHQVGPVIQRHGGRTPKDFVVLRAADANVGSLSEALRTLAVVRRREGTVASEDRTIPIAYRSTIRSSRDEPRSWVGYLETKLVQLRAQPTTRVPRLGIVRIIEISKLGQ